MAVCGEGSSMEGDEQHDAMRRLGEQVVHYEHEKSACQLRLACALQFVGASHTSGARVCPVCLCLQPLGVLPRRVSSY